MRFANLRETPEIQMEAIATTLLEYLRRGVQVLRRFKEQASKIRPLIFDSRIPEMIKSVFDGIEASIRAAIYLLILIMGLSIAAFGAFTIIFLALRLSQFLYVLFFKEPWL